MSNNKNSDVIKNANNFGDTIGDDGQNLYNKISILIEQSRRAIYSHASSTTIFLFWEIGNHINIDILENKRADYGKKVVPQLASRLTEKHGSSFALRNLRRMMQFVEQFSNFEIVSPLATQLSWSHFTEILPLKSHDAKLFYLNEAARGYVGTRGLVQRK